jgi:hypothetical protein
MDMASIWKTARPGYWIGFTGSVGSISHIDSIGISMKLPVGSPSMEIRNVHLSTTAEDTILSPDHLVDEFGQWIPAEWPGKVKSVDELKASWREEEKTLQSDTINVSKYGGFPGTMAKTTGFFHVEKINDRWWFIDPEGHYFFSTGSCCIQSGTDLSRVKGREHIYTALPPDLKLTSGRHHTAKEEISSFYTWNLYRRFGTDWYQKWTDLTIRRMDDWGLNTIANWSDESLGSLHRKAYVSTLSGWGIENGIMGMPDVYDLLYAARVDSAAKHQCAPLKNDTFLIGYFIGNEPPWPDREQELVSVILGGAATPMQAELKKYLAGGDTPERRKAFVYTTYSRFIGIVNSAVKKYDPNHLNLGFRFGGTAPEELIKASKSFDVFSFNYYGYVVDPSMIKRIYEITGLPMVIGEFHFGVPGRGLAPGLAQTSSQSERAVAYRYYVENAAAYAAIIGTHWFQWIDQPSTGRYDGENYNIGFVDVTDQPYRELINSSRETFKRIFDIHSGKEPPSTRKALVQ